MSSLSNPTFGGGGGEGGGTKGSIFMAWVTMGFMSWVAAGEGTGGVLGLGIGIAGDEVGLVAGLGTGFRVNFGMTGAIGIGCTLGAARWNLGSWILGTTGFVSADFGTAGLGAAGAEAIGTTNSRGAEGTGGLA